MTLPEGYLSRSDEGVRGFVWAELSNWHGDAFHTGDSWYGWAERQPGVEWLGGRGQALAIDAPAPGPDGRRQWVVRHYHRGGVARFLVDRYIRIGPARPLAELSASAAMRSLGIRTPAVVAGAVYRAGLFYRADLVTERVGATQDLAEVVLRDAGDVEPSLLAAGRLVRSLEEAGVEHADLNAGNILIEAGSAPPAVWVIDLDRCRVRSPEARRGETGRMLARLERSLQKITARAGRPLDRRLLTVLRAGYEGES